jgi:hypothetical protein
MIRGGFLDQTIRADLITLVQNGKAETRLTRRANALLLLDDGMSCEEIAKVLYLDDDTIRSPTISASSTLPIFGFSRHRGIPR